MIDAREREEKIVSILKRTGVPPHGFRVARPKLESLSDEEIDARLSRLDTREKTFAEWRAVREQPKRWRSPLEQGDDPSVASAITAVQESTAALKRELEDVAHALSALRLPEPDRGPIRKRLHALTTLVGFANDWACEKLSAPRFTGRDFNQVTLAKEVLRILHSSASVASFLAEGLVEEAAVAMNYHPPLPTDVPWLTATGTIDAMARAQNILREFRPDLIIAGKDEGYDLANALVHGIGITARVATFTGCGESLALDWPSSTTGADVIAVIGRLGFSGKTMCRVVREMRAKFGTEKVYGVVLATTHEAAAEMAPFGRLVYHQYTTAPGAKLRQFNPVIGVDTQLDKFVFRTADEVVSIPFDSLKVSRDQLAKVVRLEPPPWKPALQ